MSRLLVVLDLNGTLVESSYQKKDILPNCKVRKKYVYFRPFLSSFIEFLWQLWKRRKIAVAVWTSCEQRNAEAITKALFKAFPLLFIWSRSQCEVSSHSYDSKKNLQKIWNEYPEWNKDNTIIIDDTEKKIDPVENLILVPEYNTEHQEDRILVDIQDDIQKKIKNL